MRTLDCDRKLYDHPTLITGWRYFLTGLLGLGGLLASGPVVPSQWSIGLYEGDTPLTVEPIPGTASPVLTAADVSDVPAGFVADPFMVRRDGRWYLFFEVYNRLTHQGDIGCATSEDGLAWTYERIVLDESFHLSYPYAFEWEGEYYMVPETHEVNAIMLYRATDFPTDWTYVTTLVSGRAYADPSPFFHDGFWWMFAVGREIGGVYHGDLHLFYAGTLAGPWTEHPLSPLIVANPDIARPAGRVLEHDGRLLRIAQDDYPDYGNAVRAFEITTLNMLEYEESEVPESPILEASGGYWNAAGMHHHDAMRLPSGRWRAAVDGFGNGQPWPPPPPPASETWEAEEAWLIEQVRFASAERGYTGSGYADFYGEGGIEWTVAVPETGTYRLTFRYALGRGDRALAIAVNGVTVVPSLNFVRSGPWGDWSVWAEVETEVALEVGACTITAMSTGRNGPNVDHLRLEIG